MSVSVRVTSPDNPAVQVLLEQLNQYLAVRYPAENNHIDSLEELEKPNVVFVSAWEHGDALGCGAIKFLKDEIQYGEIKRLYVVEHARGRGISEMMMKHLEQAAIDRDISVLRLEAGKQQPEAFALYRKLGYLERDAFAGYKNENIELSVFMEKQLA
jgi:putative acetyltransferase